MKKKILVVDDEKDILDSLKTLLELEDYKVKTVNSGKKALDALKKEKFDLVLLDILMPKMSGREVLEKIRKKSKTQKVIFLTVVKLGQLGEEVIKKLKPTDYLQKPLRPLAIKKKIKQVLK